MRIPISPLGLNQLTRDCWGLYDSKTLQQLAHLADDPCYQQKFYKAPGADTELIAAYGYVTYGLQITPGSILFGFYLPCFNQGAVSQNPLTMLPSGFTVQLTDVSLQHKFFDDPVASIFLANYKPEFQSESPIVTPQTRNDQGSFPNLLCVPHPVVGSGLFDVEIQETSGAPQRIQLVFGVLEVCSGD